MAEATTTSHFDEETTKTTITTSFVITGFGPFGGVAENPTTVIVRKLDSYLRSPSSPNRKDETSKIHKNDRSTVADLVKEYVILETSAQAVNETMERIQQDHCSSSCDSWKKETATTTTNRRIILLHLGVGRSEGFRLESCAYNEATFRIPDQKGYQPTEQAIVSSDPVGSCYQTSLDLQGLQKQMEADFPGVSTVISTNPGRFVCNYVYCKSLEVVSSVGSKKEEEQTALDESSKALHQNNTIDASFSCESLFLHVPHFTIISEKEQLAYVACLIQNLAAAQGK